MNDIVSGFVVICILSLAIWFVMPKEEIGTINYTVLNSCSSKVEVEQFSPSAFMKTFTCTDDILYKGFDCYHMKMQGGACIKSYHYHRNKTETTSSNVEPIEETAPLIKQNETATQANSKKCTTEDGDLTICDLSYSSSYYSAQYRDTELEGNSAACVDVITGESHEVSAENIRASSNASFCVTDFGRVYIDPTLEVSKFYGAITRDGYSSPYKINGNYDTCVWTYSDGNGNIPYLEVLGNIGPRSGYNVKAFCRNGFALDVYTYRD
jgi:hypothetical protein